MFEARNMVIFVWGYHRISRAIMGYSWDWFAMVLRTFFSTLLREGFMVFNFMGRKIGISSIFPANQVCSPQGRTKLQKLWASILLETSTTKNNLTYIIYHSFFDCEIHRENTKTCFLAASPSLRWVGTSPHGGPHQQWWRLWYLEMGQNLLPYDWGNKHPLYQAINNTGKRPQTVWGVGSQRTRYKQQ